MKCKSCASHIQRAMLFVATRSLVVVGPSLPTISGFAQPQDQIANVSTQLPPEVDAAWDLFKNKGKFYVVIGADTYKDTDKNLPFVKDDAERVADTLRALDQCVAHGPGCTVQLAAGTYFTNHLYTESFRGTGKGSGMDVTKSTCRNPYEFYPLEVIV